MGDRAGSLARLGRPIIMNPARTGPVVDPCRVTPVPEDPWVGFA